MLNFRLNLYYLNLISKFQNAFLNHFQLVEFDHFDFSYVIMCIAK